MILHEIFFSAREDGTVDDKKLPSNLGVRYDDEELITHPDRKQGAIFLCPGIDGQFGELPEEGVADWRTRRQLISILVGDDFAQEWGAQKVSCYKKSEARRELQQRA